MHVSWYLRVPRQTYMYIQQINPQTRTRALKQTYTHTQIKQKQHILELGLPVCFVSYKCETTNIL